jgi:hypothetical protein
MKLLWWNETFYSTPTYTQCSRNHSEWLLLPSSLRWPSLLFVFCGCYFSILLIQAALKSYTEQYNYFPITSSLTPKVIKYSSFIKQLLWPKTFLYKTYRYVFINLFVECPSCKVLYWLQKSVLDQFSHSFFYGGKEH